MPLFRDRSASGPVPRRTCGLLALGACVVATGSAGCFLWRTAAGPGECRVKVVMQATHEVNRDRDGQSLPTSVRFYQLKDVGNLKNAGFEDVWVRAEETLGEDLVDVQESVVFPSQSKSEVLLINDEAHYLAAAAIFREPKGVTWRAFAKLPPPGDVDRCAKREPGGPYFYLIEGSTLRGSYKPFKVQAPATQE